MYSMPAEEAAVVLTEHNNSLCAATIYGPILCQGGLDEEIFHTLYVSKFIGMCRLIVL